MTATVISGVSRQAPRIAPPVLAIDVPLMTGDFLHLLSRRV
jgi:hypothetical protein